MTTDQIRALIFFTRKNTSGKTEFILMNRWYWEMVKELRQMDQSVVDFATKGTRAKVVGVCVYETSYSEEKIKEVLIKKGATYSDEFKRSCRRIEYN